MGWQDRDYARDDYVGPGRPRSPGLGGWLWGGSIVRKLIIVNVVMYVLCYYTSLGPAIRGQVMQHTVFGQVVGYPYAPGWCEMITTKVLQGQVWRLITSQYLHDVRLEHILFNMLGLFMLGQELERMWGARKFLAIYTTAGICGNLLLMAAGLIGWIAPATPAMGASGCVLGLLGAAAVLIPEAEVFIYITFIRIRTAAILVGVMYLYNIRIRGPNYGGDICHIAGLLFGGWWAWRGDRWWGARRFVSPSLRLPSRSDRGVKVGAPSRGSSHGAASPSAPEAAAPPDPHEVDRILSKVYEQRGTGGLTPEEHRILREATEHAQMQRARAGRRSEG